MQCCAASRVCDVRFGATTLAALASVASLTRFALLALSMNCPFGAYFLSKLPSSNPLKVAEQI